MRDHFNMRTATVGFWFLNSLNDQELNAVDIAVKAYDENQERIKQLEAELESMTHAAKELHGAVLEYCEMPCKSLERRMFQTAERYKKRIFNPKIWVGEQK